MRKLQICILCWCLFGLNLNAQVDLYVSSTGKAGNPGTIEKPFAKLQQVQKALIKNKARFASKAITIYIRGGTYTFTDALVFSAADSGSLANSVRIMGYPGEQVVFYGGKRLSANAFIPTTDPSVLRRLPEIARGKVLQIDLSKQGIQHFGHLQQHGFGKVPKPAPLELFINGERQALARYPNSGILPIGKLIDKGSVPPRR